MDYIFNQETESLYDFLLSNFSSLKNKNIVISQNVALKFLKSFRIAYMKEPQIERLKNGVLYTYDLTRYLDENNKVDRKLTLYDDQTHSGLYKIMTFNCQNMKYKSSVYNTETIYVFDNENDKNLFKNREKNL